VSASPHGLQASGATREPYLQKSRGLGQSPKLGTAEPGTPRPRRSDRRHLTGFAALPPLGIRVTLTQSGGVGKMGWKKSPAATVELRGKQEVPGMEVRLTEEQIDAIRQRHGLLEVEGGGSAYVLISMESFRQMMGVGSDASYQASLNAIREGLADVEAGRTRSMDEFFGDFDRRHGLSN
jgi:PHD/YefM family antitoxin component YafN of YafNO toxin-antitoxin module